MLLDALMTRIFPSSHLLKMKQITVLNERFQMEGQYEIYAVTTTAVKTILMIHNLFGHLHFLQIQKQQLLFFLLDFKILPVHGIVAISFSSVLLYFVIFCLFAVG